jgi:hypothetical protein
MLGWVAAAVALAVAVSAWVRAGRVKRKLDALNQSYWELRYDFTRLRSQVARLDPAEAEQTGPAAPPPGQLAFVPLSSVRKKS